MAKIDWMYHRNSCKTCERAQSFLAKAKVAPKEITDARKIRIGPKAALEMAAGASKIVATKGKKIISLDLDKDKPGAEALTALIVGPSGNLRAPTMRIGSTMVVGFDEEMYKAALK